MTLATSPSQIPHRSIHFYTVARKLRKVAVAGELRMAFVRWPFTSFAAERFAKTNRHLGAVQHQCNCTNMPHCLLKTSPGGCKANVGLVSCFSYFTPCSKQKGDVR